MVNKFTMKAFRLLFALLLVSGTVSAQSWEQPYAGRGFTVQDTVICGRRAVFVVPPQANGRWIARPAFIGAFAQVDDALLELGWSFGLLDLMDEYATPGAQEAFTAFCDYGHKRYGLSRKVVLEGLSRGGWFSLVYAENHPDRVDKLYLDAPLCDLTKFRNEHIRKAGEQWAAAGIPEEKFRTFPSSERPASAIIRIRSARATRSCASWPSRSGYSWEMISLTRAFQSTTRSGFGE